MRKVFNKNKSRAKALLVVSGPPIPTIERSSLGQSGANITCAAIYTEV